MMLEFELAEVLLSYVGAVRSCTPLYRLLSTPTCKKYKTEGVRRVTKYSI